MSNVTEGHWIIFTNHALQGLKSAMGKQLEKSQIREAMRSSQEMDLRCVIAIGYRPKVNKRSIEETTFLRPLGLEFSEKNIIFVLGKGMGKRKFVWVTTYCDNKRNLFFKKKAHLRHISKLPNIHK